MLELLIPPAAEPISLSDARAHLRLDATGSPPSHPDDALVESLITAARQHLDGKHGILGRALVTQTWRLKLGGWPSSRRIALPLAPFQSVAAINYRDEDDVLQPFAATSYSAHRDEMERGMVTIHSDVLLPRTRDRVDAVVVDFVVGYGGPSDIPAPLVHAMKLHIGAMYEHREAAVIGATPQVMPFAYDMLVAPYRARWC